MLIIGLFFIQHVSAEIEGERGKHKRLLIERVYSNIAYDMNFDKPVVFTGDSMVHRMNWNYIFQNIENKNTPVIFNRG